MTNDVCKSKMAAKIATTNMKKITMTITSLFNSLRIFYFFVYSQVLSPREYERLYLISKRYSQIQDGCQFSHNKYEIC